MFTSDMAESRQKTVVLQGLDAGMFEEILNFFYSGTLHVTLDKVQPLYQAADLLQLDYVRDTCSGYMAINVVRSTCMDLYKFADVFSVDIVHKCCLQWITRHFTEVASSEEFCSLSVNQLTEIISHDELDVKEETTVWEAVVRWVQYSREDRLHHLPSILPHIRFYLLSSDDTAAILDHPVVREDPGSCEVIRNVVQKGNPNLNQRLRLSTEMVLLSIENSSDLLFMNPREGKYITCSYDRKDLPNYPDLIVTSDNNIYSLTREQGSNNQLSVVKYNYAENVWEDAGMSSVFSKWLRLEKDIKFYHEQLVEVDRTLYYLAENVSEGVWMRKYNRHIDQWLECSPLKFDNASYNYSTAVSCGSHLYFITTTEAHRYDPSEDCWCKRTPPSNSSDLCTAVAIGTEIFCTDHDFTQTMVYDTESDCWQKLQGWPDPGNHRDVDVCPTLFVMENQLHVWFTCGYDEDIKEHLVYVYDKSAGAWRDLKATLPSSNKTYLTCGSQCPVARIYLPDL
ncbi:kelch repeat and BTB domain-containing protein 2-like [Branchiostoma floridae]|uniref:Kelch repeat and BTB domain-containing protein 2-like n=1 Tax=Branchiostoma floridae TaxID=7739 RepID=A0A9J7LTQ1_BRAFL|nr:kelch repeat and BTB domain-containing protein 2-like [Branchiostoma floridae]